MLCGDNDPECVKNAWNAILDAEKQDDQRALLNRANALENYARVLKEEKLRLLDAANAEVKAKQLRAEYFKLEMENESVQDWEIQLGIMNANNQTRKSASVKHEDWTIEEQINTARSFSLWTRFFAGPLGEELNKSFKRWLKRCLKK